MLYYVYDKHNQLMAQFAFLPMAQACSDTVEDSYVVDILTNDCIYSQTEIAERLYEENLATFGAVSVRLGKHGERRTFSTQELRLMAESLALPEKPSILLLAAIVAAHRKRNTVGRK